jgi:hypothetical protein
MSFCVFFQALMFYRNTPEIPRRNVHRGLTVFQNSEGMPSPGKNGIQHAQLSIYESCAPKRCHPKEQNLAKVKSRVLKSVVDLGAIGCN